MWARSPPPTTRSTTRPGHPSAPATWRRRSSVDGPPGPPAASAGGPPMIRIAAAGDLHFGVDSAGQFREHSDDLVDQACALLLAGDLTKRGRPEEAEVLAEEMSDLALPV